MTFDGQSKIKRRTKEEVSSSLLGKLAPPFFVTNIFLVKRYS